MKKTVNINLNGVVFYIDDDAYKTLRSYLDRLELHFKNQEEGKEVIKDIESRIAELFSEKINHESGVVTQVMVTEVMAIMGDPSEFDEDEEPKKEKKSHYQAYTTSSRSKRLFRDADNKVLGGVCSGIAAYLNIDPVLVRVAFGIFLFLSAGTIIPVYIILWILIPAAITTAQKLEMRGENVTINNIEKFIKREYEDVKDRFSKVKDTETYKKSESWWRRLTKRDKNLMLVVAVIASVSLLTGLFNAFPAMEPMTTNVSYHMAHVPILHFPGILILTLILLLIGFVFKTLFKIIIYIIAFLFIIALALKVVGFFVGSVAMLC
ncbi:PspC domain-containing protein [Saccharicrinis aurantiacus]|uniref:PspC domain-containing protein n=1 Tax=Saccharicrinis aurantiacus TaxID=1849719 RepID=UPI0024906EE4|nr:PspC domain-containing protein [Saccharicrinis aurantiacus]